MKFWYFVLTHNHEGDGIVIDLRSDLAKVVGSENTIDDPSILELCTKDVNFCDPMVPGFEIKSIHADEVQTTAKLANRNNTPLLPVGSGPSCKWQQALII